MDLAHAHSVAGRARRPAEAFPSPPKLARPAREYLDRLYVDTVGYAVAPLEYCYTQLGAGRLLFGTDHPYAAPSLPGQLIGRLPCTRAEREQILSGNAQRLLRLDALLAAHVRDS
jgi:predicted TIM-barrel fold metal-dependent hydrolase